MEAATAGQAPAGAGGQEPRKFPVKWILWGVLAAMLVVRGGPVLLWFRRELPRTERMQAALYSTTTLPLLVALTELAVADGSMPTDIGAALVGAGVLSVVALPMIASRLGRRDRDDPRARPDAGPADGVAETV